ncbi:MAG: hypothetical protein HYS12_11335 [Planctomycetes bacterium]|nr:hypothetical protein [Planctomycetota bacterium]
MTLIDNSVPVSHPMARNDVDRQGLPDVAQGRFHLDTDGARIRVWLLDDREHDPGPAVDAGIAALGLRRLDNAGHLR